MRRLILFGGACAILLFLFPAVWAQGTPKALSNADVIKMVQAGVSESAVVATIRANPGNYDTSPHGLIELHKAGVSDAEVNAIAAAGSGASPAGAAGSGSGAPTAAAAAAPAPAPRFQMPTVTLVQSGASQELPLEKTQLAQTKTKPSSLASLAGDSAMTQAIQAGVGTATSSAAAHINSGVGGSSVQQAGTVLSGMLARRKPTVTYVWGVPGAASANVLQTTLPKFSVNFAKTPGVNAGEFAPEIVKLTPAQNTCRLVGATEGKEDAGSHDAADWEIYSSFVEDRVAVELQKTGTGEYLISPQAALLPGEYAVVLRPIAKAEKFSGGDVARAQGPGLMFDTVWSFAVADTAH